MSRNCLGNDYNTGQLTQAAFAKRNKCLKLKLTNRETADTERKVVKFEFPHLFLFVLSLYFLCWGNVPTSNLFHLPSGTPVCLMNDTCNPNAHAKPGAALGLSVPVLAEEVSGAIRGAYPAGDQQRAHNPITHPCSSLDPHYHLPWRGLLGQMIGTPHIPTSPPPVSPGTLAHTQGYDYKHHLFSRLNSSWLVFIPAKDKILSAVRPDQYEHRRSEMAGERQSHVPAP